MTKQYDRDTVKWWEMILPIVVGLILFLTLVSFAKSSDYYNYYSDGYCYRNGYWYYGQGRDAYTRYWVNPYYYCNRYYPGYYYYNFHHTDCDTCIPTHKEVGWRTRILEIAAARDKDIRESRDWSDAIKALGLPAYAAVSTGYSYSHGFPYGGSTVYGYSYNKASDFYGDSAINLSAGFQSLARLADSQQKGTAQIAADLADILNQDGASRERVAAILARGQATSQILNNLESARSTVKERIDLTVPGTAGASTSTSMTANEDQLWEKSATQCLQCHNAQKKQSGIDMTQFRAFPTAKQLHIVSRILLPPNHPQHMPKDGPQLSPEEVSLWVKQIVAKMQKNPS
jgi:hypothetical protein